VQEQAASRGYCVLPAIGIDYTPAYEQGGGIGRYVRELIAALAALDDQTDYRLFVAGASARPLPPLPGTNFRWAASRIPPIWFARLWNRARLPIQVERWVGPVALYHATDFVLPPTRPSTRTVLTVHDLSFVRAPDAASPALRRYLDRVVPRSVRRADHVLADSQATKDDLIALCGTAPQKIDVLLSGVNPRFKPVRDPVALAAVRTRYQIGDAPFVLSVGTVQPRKNYERLMSAMARLPGDLQGTHLVIAGGRGWLQGPIYAAVESLGLRDRVHFIGFADDADLPALYSAARALAFPSLYEGFGLPVLEAMACGTPVVTSNVSSLVEVAGDATLLVDPLSVEQIADSLVRLLTDDDERAALIERGLRRAASFTWDRAAVQLRALYERLCTSPGTAMSP
jgi:glycosyltransferase involved in cell wall biosynthesis